MNRTPFIYSPEEDSTYINNLITQEGHIRKLSTNTFGIYFQLGFIAPVTGKACEDELPYSRYLIHKHTKVLEELGYINIERRGGKEYYTLNELPPI